MALMCVSVCLNGVLFHKDNEFVRNSIAMALCVFVCVREGDCLYLKKLAKGSYKTKDAEAD